MSPADSDRELVVDELGREPTPAEAALFETSGASTVRTAPQDRCSRPSTARASRSSSGRATTRRWSRCREARTGTTARTSRWVSRATTSPSYVNPFDGAATGVGGIVRDTLSMGAYPIVLADSLYFGEFDREPENEESQKRRIELRDIDQ